MDKRVLSEAINEVLSQLSLMNDTMSLNYVKMEDAELHIQEEKIVPWIRRLVAESPRPSSSAANLEAYEDSLVEFQSKRSFVTLVDRGDDPSGFKVWATVKGKSVPDEIPQENISEDDEVDIETQVLDSLEKADQFFKDNSLTEAAKKLGISRNDAADLKVAIPLLQRRAKEKLLTKIHAADQLLPPSGSLN
jgi:hypothetical protein